MVWKEMCGVIVQLPKRGHSRPLCFDTWFDPLSRRKAIFPSVWVISIR